MRYENMKKIWDDKKGKYIKEIFKSKPIKIMTWLYFDGRRLYWDIPEPNEEEYIPTRDLTIPIEEWEIKVKKSWTYRFYLKEHKLYKRQKYLNMVLSVLPYIPLTGLILGVI